MNAEPLEARIIELESLLARQERLMDDLSGEILRLNRLVELLSRRLEAHEARHAVPDSIRPLTEEVPPPHY